MEYRIQLHAYRV